MAVVHRKFQKMLYVLQFCGTITNTWPPRPDVGKIELFFRNLYYYIAIFILVAVWIPMVMSIYNKQNDDIGILMKDVSHVAASIEAILNAIMCTMKRKQLQSLLASIEKFLKASNNHEILILEKYVDRYATFILVVASSFAVAGITVVAAPLFMPLEFPAAVWYPFSTEPLLRKFILYIMQIFIIAQTVLCLGVDVMIAVFLFYSTARLEMLSLEVTQATNEISIILCAKKHQEIIGFISKTQQAIQYVLFKTTLTMGFTVISGCFPMLYLQSHALIPQFISMIMAALQRMYITAWAADDLKEVSTQFPWSVYNASWIGKSLKIKNNIFIILQRSQQPFLISMGGLLPALTLEYYANFVTSVLSYFMTMRVAIAT